VALVGLRGPLASGASSGSSGVRARFLYPNSGVEDGDTAGDAIAWRSVITESFARTAEAAARCSASRAGCRAVVCGELVIMRAMRCMRSIDRPVTKGMAESNVMSCPAQSRQSGDGGDTRESAASGSSRTLARRDGQWTRSMWASSCSHIVMAS
jgi:hypothetical protein